MKKRKNDYYVDLLSSKEQIDLYNLMEYLQSIDFSKYDYATIFDYSSFSEKDYNIRLAIIDHENKNAFIELCYEQPYNNFRINTFERV